MKLSSVEIRNAIVQKLISGAFFSGEQLGSALGISRAAVAKHIKSLQDLGLDIFSVSGRGYKLAHNIALFDKNAILTQLPDYQNRLFLIPVIHSTNDFLKEKLAAKEIAQGAVCIAEAQTAGRGRQGRKWISPFGCSLYFSMYREFTGGFQAISGLSLAVGLAVVRTLSMLGAQNVGLKWPNDIYCNGKKLAGILIDVEGNMHDQCQTIIGLGVNITLPGNINAIDQPFTDLKTVLNNSGQHAVDKNQLVVDVIQSMNSVLAQFANQGLAPLVDEWNALDIYRDKPIRLIHGDREIVGVAKGIDTTGALRLQIQDETDQPVIRSFFGGEVSGGKVSVRPQA